MYYCLNDFIMFRLCSFYNEQKPIYNTKLYTTRYKTILDNYICDFKFKNYIFYLLFLSNNLFMRDMLKMCTNVV